MVDHGLAPASRRAARLPAVTCRPEHEVEEPEPETTLEVEEPTIRPKHPRCKPLSVDAVVEGEVQSGTHGVSCVEALRSYHGEPALASCSAVRGPSGQGRPSHVHSVEADPGPRLTMGWLLQVGARRDSPR